jgi:hypothetical protein
VANRLKLQAESVKDASECRRRIDEERGLLDLLLLTEFAQKQQCKLRGSCLKQPSV